MHAGEQNASRLRLDVCATGCFDWLRLLFVSGLMMCKRRDLTCVWSSQCHAGRGSVNGATNSDCPVSAGGARGGTQPRLQQLPAFPGSANGKMDRQQLQPRAPRCIAVHGAAARAATGAQSVPLITSRALTLLPPPPPLQVPDFVNARIGGVPATDLIRDMKWFREEFTPKVALRGGALIKKWGRSSAASTAVSVADAIRALVVPTAPGDCFSTGVISDGNPYGVRDGLVFSFPCRCEAGNAGLARGVGGQAGPFCIRCACPWIHLSTTTWVFFGGGGEHGTHSTAQGGGRHDGKGPCCAAAVLHVMHARLTRTGSRQHRQHGWLPAPVASQRCGVGRCMSRPRIKGMQQHATSLL